MRIPVADPIAYLPPGLLRSLLDQFPDALFLLSLNHVQEEEGNQKSSTVACFDYGEKDRCPGGPASGIGNPVRSVLDWHGLAQLLREGGEKVIWQAGLEFPEMPVRLRPLEFEGREYIVGLGRDTAGQSALEEALAEERNKLEALMSALGDGITVQDRNFRILYQNRIHQEKQGNHVGEICYQAYQNRDSVCDGCLVAQCFEDGQMHRRQTVAKAGKRDLYLEVTCSPMLNAKGEIVAGVEAVRDISEQKRLEIFKDEMIASISHEMSTPLTALLGFTEFLIENSIGEEEKKEYLRIMLAEGERLQDLIENLLLSQQLRMQEAGCLRIETVPVAALLEQVERAFPSISFGRHSLAINYPKKIGGIQGDWEKLARAIKNLVANAVKYSPDGSSIRITAEEGDPGEVIISVQDQGLGIPAEYQEKIFERFFQYAHAGQSKISGVGLGLALVRDIAEAHRGRIWVESRPGRGSRFCLALPREQDGSGSGEIVRLRLPRS